MSFRFDHAIVAVQDLETAVRDYHNMGFTVLEGGEHADGATHNALICFRDGSYIELLAPTGRASNNPSALGYSKWLNMGDGLIGYALLSDDLEADVKAMKSKGIKIGDIRTGGRTTLDGVELQWNSATIEGTLSPFFIQDITRRTERVPSDIGFTTHPNQVNGIIEIGFVSDDVARMGQFYSAILSTKGEKFDGDTVFDVAGTTLTIASPRSKEKREYATKRGDLPYDLVLRTSSYRWARSSDLVNTHGANFRVLAHVAP